MRIGVSGGGEFPREVRDAGGKCEVAAYLRLRGSTEPPPEARIGDQPGERGGERRGIVCRHEETGGAVLDELADPRKRGRDASEALALRLEENVRQAVAVAVG